MTLTVTRAAQIAGIALVLSVAHAQAADCPSPIAGHKIPTASWSVTSTHPTYYAADSAIINVGNGQPVTPSATRAQVKASMGAAFTNAQFKVVGGPGSGPANGFMSCSYDGPRYAKGGKTLQATVNIACVSSCSGL